MRKLYNLNGWIMKFKASEYLVYNQKMGFTRYKDLYAIMQEIFNLSAFSEKEFEDGEVFKYDGMLFCIDKVMGSYCEVIGSGWLPIEERLKIHQKKLKQYKQDVVQIKLF